MDLRKFLEKYPEVQVATARDEGRLREFFHRVPMKGEGMQLQYLRDPDFFAFLNCHSAHSFVIYVQNPEGVIEGAGTFVFRPAMVHGKREMIAYLGDLRVDNIRRWGRYWRTFYLDFMQHAHAIQEFHGARYHLTAIMNQNSKAKKALADSPIGYHHYHDYCMINVLRAWRPVSRTFEEKSWDKIARPELDQFYRAANLTKHFGWVMDDDYNELEWRKQHWKNFNFSDGFALYDRHGIAVSGAFWSPRQVKKIVVQRLPENLQRLYSLLRFIVRLPQEGEELKCLYLTTLDKRADLSEKDYQRGVRQLVNIGLRLAKERGYHCVSVAEFASSPLKAALAPYVSVKTDLELYFVDSTRNPVTDFTREVPGFEMGLV